MKRAVSSALVAGNDEVLPMAREAALSLLERSISYGHGRLAVIRLSIAAEVGADVSPYCWNYCEAAVVGSGDPQLEALFERARTMSRSFANAVTPIDSPQQETSK